MYCDEEWGSVRKVRYMDDIEAFARYALQYRNMKFSEDTFLSQFISEREDRHNLVQKHYKRGIQRTRTSMYETKFKITLPDSLTFMREMKILAVKDGLVIPLQLAEKLKSMSEESQKRRAVLEYVLSSKYKTYQCFLKHLVQLGEFVVPFGYSKRDDQTRSFINREGFMTDTASFYTTRDLFYELDTVNWCVDDKRNLIMYPTVSTGKEDKDNWHEHLTIGNLALNLRKKVDEELFLDEMIDAYLNLTGRRFMANADLIQLRDAFCRKHRLGDFYFKELLLHLVRNESIPYRIILSFGTVSMRKPNYDLKIVSLPKLSSNRLALYIAIEEGAR